MDEKRFRDVEVRFKILSDQHRQGEINSETLKKELKKMMILDEKNRYWMLGGKTGKWYVYSGKEWNENNPYQQDLKTDDEPESFETRLFSKEESESVIGATGTDSGKHRQADSATVQLNAADAVRESDSQDVDIVLTQEDRNESDLEVVSLQDDSGAADLEVVHNQESDSVVQPDSLSAQADGYGDLEVVSMQEEVKASDYEVDLTGADEIGGHDFVLPGDTGEAADLEVVSVQEDSGAPAADTFDVSGMEEDAALVLGEDEQVREEPVDISPDTSREEIEKVPSQKVETVPRPAAPAKPEKKVQPIDELVISSIDMVSLIFFLGGIGMIVGVLFGATFGIFTGVFGDLINYFPELLRGVQGGFAGGLLFAAIGGIGGALFFALAAVVISSLYNLIAFIFGGIRLKIK